MRVLQIFNSAHFAFSALNGFCSRVIIRNPKLLPISLVKKIGFLSAGECIRIINEDAFVDVTGMGDTCKNYLQKQEYPFTEHGDEEIKKNWYLSFRNSIGIIIVRDLLTVVAFLVSPYLAIKEIFQ